MNSFLSAYKNELYKISKKKKFIAAALLGVLAVVLCGGLSALLNRFGGVGLLYGGEFATGFLPVFEYTLIPLFTIFNAADMFTGEFSSDTIKLTLTRPVTRFKIYSAKVMAAATFLLGFLLYCAAAAIITSFFFGAGSANTVGALKAYTAAFVPLAVLMLMTVFIANFAKGSGAAFLITVVAFILLKALEFGFPGVKSFLFTAGFDWYKPLLGSYVNFFAVLRRFLVFLGSGVVFFGAGYLLFEKRSF